MEEIGKACFWAESRLFVFCFFSPSWSLFFKGEMGHGLITPQGGSYNLVSSETSQIHWMVWIHTLNKVEH